MRKKPEYIVIFKNKRMKEDQGLKLLNQWGCTLNEKTKRGTPKAKGVLHFKGPKETTDDQRYYKKFNIAAVDMEESVVEKIRRDPEVHRVVKNERRVVLGVKGRVFDSAQVQPYALKSRLFSGGSGQPLPETGGGGRSLVFGVARAVLCRSAVARAELCPSQVAQAVFCRSFSPVTLVLI